MFRRTNGIGSFLLGTGIGVVGGILINQWLERRGMMGDEQNQYEQYEHDETHFKIDKDEIAKYAEQFLKEEGNTEHQSSIH